MADGDIRLDDEVEFQDGTRAVLFAVESSDHPGGINYRMAYFDPETGDMLLRYDNSRVPRHGAGVHHRHEGDDVAEISFESLQNHVSRFRSEVSTIHDQC